ARLFSKRIWEHARILFIGAILSPAERTVTAALRVMGLSGEKHFENYHRVLNRAVWSSLEASHILLGLLISAFASSGPILMGLDDTIERRRGAKIKAKGIYRDPVRSSHSHFVKASGLRWLSLMFLTPIPWAKRVWALPFLTVLAPSERYYKAKVHKRKKLTEWAYQMILQARRWPPKRRLVVVADSSFAVIDLLWQLRQLKNPICMITRFRLDAALYEPHKPTPGKMGRPRKKGKRLPTLEKIAEDKRTRWKPLTAQEWYGEKKRDIEITSQTAVWFHSGQPPVPIRWVKVRDPKKVFKTQALLCTDLSLSAEQIIEWFVRRWQVEVTFHEVRTHLGVETQRQWADLSILRSTSALLGLFSIVTLLANLHAQNQKLPVQQAAWYNKQLPTFSDALRIVKQSLFSSRHFRTSQFCGEIRKVPHFRTQYRYSRSFRTFLCLSNG
ncbi:MAG: transposase, partial [Anaerolineales bacterium]|nr:transposase [Anaerolineales bacterium]